MLFVYVCVCLFCFICLCVFVLFVCVCLCLNVCVIVSLFTSCVYVCSCIVFFTQKHTYTQTITYKHTKTHLRHAQKILMTHFAIVYVFYISQRQKVLLQVIHYSFRVPWRPVLVVMMCQQRRAFLFLCKILCHYVSYSYSKTLAYGKKKQFLVKMSLYPPLHVPFP